MVNVICDTCGAVKPQKEAGKEDGFEWILGYDLQVQSPKSLQRSIRFLDHWDDRRILELGAIHLCSLECRDKYVRRAA